MKQALMLLLAFVIVWFVWRIVMGLVGGLLGMVFHLAIIGLFCYLIYVVYKALMREKI